VSRHSRAVTPQDLAGEDLEVLRVPAGEPRDALQVTTCRREGFERAFVIPDDETVEDGRRDGRGPAGVRHFESRLIEVPGREERRAVVVRRDSLKERAAQRI